MFEDLFSLDNLFYAWKKFRRGKNKKRDIVEFEFNLEDNIFSLHNDILTGKYRHGIYYFFQVFDNKKRDIYKACVRDRIVHQIIYDYLNRIYESIFIADSYSSRRSKGNLKAIDVFKYFIKLCTNGYSKKCYVLKCDIKKYFHNIDHKVLIKQISEKIECDETLKIIKNIVESFPSDRNIKKGIPLGNITSQIFANIYLHKLDIYIKNKLKCNYYIRYNDDFVIIDASKTKLDMVKNLIVNFVKNELFLEIPQYKISIRKDLQGIVFLGYVILPNCVLLKNKTKDKMYKNLNQKNFSSYFGILKWCNSYNLKQKVFSRFEFLDFKECEIDI
jgi:RNA-directed DNA polymerase